MKSRVVVPISYISQESLNLAYREKNSQKANSSIPSMRSPEAVPQVVNIKCTHKICDWPAVPRSGDLVCIISSTGELRVTEVLWTYTGEVQVHLEELDMRNTADQNDVVSSLVDAGWNFE